MPVALLIETQWSTPCDAFDREILTDSGVNEVMCARYVAVRADADLRPDLADRYTADGWPTLVVLTPHGWPLAPVPTSNPVECAAGLRDIAAAFDSRRAQILREVPAPSPPAPIGTDAPDPVMVIAGWLARWEGADGILRAAETPQAIETSIDVASRTGRGDLVRRAVDVLERLAASPLRDATSGAWFRAAPLGRAGWEPVQLLDDQAAWLSADVAAQAAQPIPGRGRRIAALVTTIERSFAGPGGVAHARYRLGAPDESLRVAFDDECRRDGRGFVDVQARMAHALMRAGGAMNMPGWTSRAIDRLDELVSAAYRRDGGVAHVLDPAPRLRGLLGDQVAVAAALLDAWEVSARPVYLDAADELLRSTVRKFTDSATGLLRDRIPTPAGAGDVGLLGHAAYPTAHNVTAAECLLQLAVYRDDPGQRERAHAILSACLASVDLDDPSHARLVSMIRAARGGGPARDPA